MRTNSRVTMQHREQVMFYLKNEGFLCGYTKTGFIGVDDDGIVIQCTPYRTSAQIRHNTTRRIREEYVKKVPTTDWFTRIIDELTQWANDPKAVVPPRVLQSSNRPVPSKVKA